MARPAGSNSFSELFIRDARHAPRQHFFSICCALFQRWGLRGQLLILGDINLRVVQELAGRRAAVRPFSSRCAWPGGRCGAPSCATCCRRAPRLVCAAPPLLKMAQALQSPFIADKFKLPEACGRVARRRSRKATPSDPSCPKALPTSCGAVAKCWPNLADGSVTMFGQHRQTLADVWPMVDVWPMFGQIRLNVGRH